MDWSNERYVRLYTRDTVSWNRLRWEGQTVLMHLLRKLDRAGVLDLGGFEPHEAVESVTGLPENIIKTGLNKCLELGVFVVDIDRILMPNFLDAQESVASGAERMRRLRAKQKAVVAAAERNETSPEHNKTSAQRDVTSLNVTNVTSGVTPCDESDAVPSVPSVPSNSPGSGEPTVQEQIEELEKRYDLELVKEAREACSLSRKHGRMADSVWLRVLTKLETYSQEASEGAMRLMVEKYGDGEKSEQYMIAIASRWKDKGDGQNVRRRELTEEENRARIEKRAREYDERMARGEGPVTDPDQQVIGRLLRNVDDA